MTDAEFEELRRLEQKRDRYRFLALICRIMVYLGILFLVWSACK